MVDSSLLKDGDIVYWKDGPIKLKLSLGLCYPGYPEDSKRWVKVLESNHLPYKRGMTFVLDMNEVSLK